MLEVKHFLNLENLTVQIEALKQKHSEPPWVEKLIETEQFRLVVICHPPGYENDYHYHTNDECWVVVEGEMAWHYEHEPWPHRVTAPAVVFAPKNLWHHIEILGDKPAIRIAISAPGEFHRYDRPGARPVRREQS